MTSLNETTFKSLFTTAPDPYLVLLPNFTITAVNDAYLKATMTEREAILGHNLFEIFPDNASDTEADGVLNLKASLSYVLQYKQPHTMPVQKYDIRRPNGIFEVRYWSPLNIPVLNAQNELLYIIHNVKDVTDKYKEEQKFKRSEKYYQLLVNSVKDYAIFMIDVNGCVVNWNSGAEIIKGYTPEEITGKPIDIFYTAAAIKNGEPQRNLQMALQHGHFETEGWRVRKDGTIFWANIILTALKDEEGLLNGYSKITRDITERKKVQEQLELLSRQINQSNDSIYTTDANQKIKSWNKGAEKLYGYTNEEMLGKDSNVVLKTALSEEEMNTIIKEIAKRDYWTAELMRTTKAHKNIWVRNSVSTIRDDGEEITGYVATSFDITEQKKLLDEIGHLANMVEQSTEAIFSIELDERIISWNSGAEKLYGYSKEEAIGKTSAALGLINLTEVEKKDILLQVFEIGVWKTEGNYFRKDGSSFFGVVTANVIKNEKGVITGSFFIVKDISERKRLEEQLKEFEHFFNNSNDFSCIANKEGYFEILNPSFEKVLGYSQNELSQNPFIYFVHPDDIDATLHEYEKLKSGALLIYFFNRYRKKDGSYLWFEWNATPNPVTGKLYCIARDITDRKKAEDALSKLNAELEQRVKERTVEIEKNEMRFRSLIENSAEGIALTDEFSNIIYCSPASQKIKGVLSKENMVNLMHPADIENFRNKRAEALSKPSIPVSFQGQFLHSDGYYFWMEGTLTNMMEVKGVNAIVANYRDITSRKKLENLLNKANTLARIGGWEVDMIKQTVYWSDITREIHETAYEYVPDLETGINFYKEGKGRDLITQKVKEAIELGKPWDVELQIITAKNNTRWIRTIGETEFVNNKCVRIYGSFQDIDQRKKVEEKLVESERRFRALVENNKDVIMLLDESLKVTYRSPSATEVNGWMDEDVKDLSGLQNIHPDDIPYAVNIIKEMMANPGKPLPVIFRNRHKNGHFTWLEGVVTNLLQDKYVHSILFNFRDVTERIEAAEKIKNLNADLEEKILVRTQQLRKSNEELEAFSYSVSHDLRAPLRAIIGYTSMLEEDYSSKLDDEAKRITGIIKGNTEKMGHLIDDLLAFSRMGRHELLKKTIDTNQLLAEIKTGIDNSEAAVKNITWIIHPLPCIHADINTIRQVWINLLMNAVKYSAKAEAPLIEVGSFKQNGQTIFFIKDNGAGFNEKYKNKLFKVFQRLHSEQEFEGTGIGLAIVEKIISKHGGHVWAEGEVNKGASFYFTLPDK